MVIKLAHLVVGSFMLSLPASAQTVTTPDFDLTCAVVSSIELALAQKDTSQFSNAFGMTSFYYGRLSARDDKAFWGAIVKGRVAERHGQPNPEPVVSACVDFYSKKLD